MSRPSIGVAATFRDEHNALPGFLEAASRFFDEILLVDCSSDMTPSSDGSLDIIRKWGLPDPPLWDLSPGFGAVRGQLLQTSKTDWTVIMDIDERMHVTLPFMFCNGTESFPAVENPNLIVREGGAVFHHREHLMQRIAEADARGIKAVRFCRRHWFDAGMKRPTQNWTQIRDWQLRCMKSRSSVGFKSDVKMHEQAWDFARNSSPLYIEDTNDQGPFLDHLHCHFKPMEVEQRQADIATYDALHKSDIHTPIAR